MEEMKNVVRKKLGLSSSLPVHLSQLRDGKLIVLEDGIRLNFLFDYKGLNIYISKMTTLTRSMPLFT